MTSQYPQHSHGERRVYGGVLPGEAAAAVSESAGGVKPPLFPEIKVFREFVCVDARVMSRVLATTKYRAHSHHCFSAADGLLWI